MPASRTELRRLDITVNRIAKDDGSTHYEVKLRSAPKHLGTIRPIFILLRDAGARTCGPCDGDTDSLTVRVGTNTHARYTAGCRTEGGRWVEGLTASNSADSALGKLSEHVWADAADGYQAAGQRNRWLATAILGAG